MFTNVSWIAMLRCSLYGSKHTFTRTQRGELAGARLPHKLDLNQKPERIATNKDTRLNVS